MGSIPVPSILDRRDRMTVSNIDINSDLVEENALPQDSLQSNRKGSTEKGKKNRRNSNFDQQLSDSIVANRGTSLPEDVYSMIFVARLWSSSFFYALFCILYQFLIIWLLIYNEFDFESSDNKFKIPFRVPRLVTAAQGLGIYLTVCISEDLLQGCELISGGYPWHISIHIPSATRTKWYISCFAKLLEGAGCTFVIFMLVVQSEEIVSLFLNFAALTFVWAIDDIFFSMAGKGFFTEDITKCAADVSAVSISPPSKKSLYIRNTTFGVVLACFYAIWARVLHLQYTNSFMCKSLLVQFDDTYEPLPSRYSGVYNRRSGEINDRIVYEKKLPSKLLGTEKTRKNAYIAYCGKSSTWTLSVSKSSNIDPCNEETKLAQSETIVSYDITSQADATWFTKRPYKDRYVPFEFKVIECLDCDNDLNPLRSSCSGSESGQCVDGRCKCNKGHFGLSCEFFAPCETLVPYAGDSFSDRCINHQLGNSARQYENNFILLKPDNNTADFVNVNDQPVYHQEFNKNIRKNCTGPFEIGPGEDGPGQGIGSPPVPEIGLLLFNGYRWVLIDASDLEDFEFKADSINKKPELIAYMKDSFHPVFSNYTANYYSEPMKYSTNGEQATPELLIWHRANVFMNLEYSNQGIPGLEAVEFQQMKCY